MQVDYTPTEPVKIKIVWNGHVIKEEDIGANERYQMNLSLPKVTDGEVKCIAVKADGTEEVLGHDTHKVDATPAADTKDAGDKKDGGCDCGCGGCDDK